MVSFRATLFALAGAAIAMAQTTGADCTAANCFNVPTNGYQTSAGSSVNLTWGNLAGSTVTLKLVYGLESNLTTIATIVSGLANNGQYTWSVPNDEVRGDAYAVEIINEQNTSEVNYTPRFNIDSTVLYSSTASGSTSATTSAASSTGSNTASTTGSASKTSSGTSSVSASVTASTASAGLQTTSSHTGGATRATAVAGFLGAVALGALAL